MRAIDADAMIDRLKEWDTKDKTDKALYNFTLNRINEQPTIQPEPHWITERFPEEECECLVTVVSGKKVYVSLCEYDPIIGFCPHDADEYTSTAFVTAWLPLPEPYKEVTT